MNDLSILFISIEGNTRSFLKRLVSYAEQQHVINKADPAVTLKEITDQTLPAKETQPFFIFVPTYLDGGNGFDSGFTEMMTNSLGEYVEQNDNTKLCMGIVGSGNKNFNEQYCLTAREYSAKFNVPFLADYELRGTDRDVERIYGVLKQRASEFESEK
ncbi:class Ib ribonucleoside-diphosphate reductase assembly flavoprotein NrdI [Lactobacillus sp. 3B(2020)]|uniref:class Ib ribonucleoside-diphosphate reductase assembly flavoprotein NrdI n=1 Tax=Lactobacillus sp. 3B(2020) TaxID=2695882 RepID=UPI0015DF520B|nr:class Ib ribonucleoside-diphosphate reductase assembly flavoprotein NrdI [Lactobacillus sp. 3B(2020)]QLL70876.1 class Ib ribonucleoside-diphosphate reductase assembly flavoprotein NrdI [Lactobacillus sp. 3B(2020)]